MAPKIIGLLSSWAQEVQERVGKGEVYLFGSLVYRDGSQFVAESDVDLLAVIPQGINTPLHRLGWLKRLRPLKQDLEAKLSKALNRPVSKQICSIVTVSEIELKGDIHKDGASAFFERNQFLDLSTGARSNGISGAGTAKITDPLIQSCLRFVQKKRNIYLDVTADGSTN